MARRFNLNTSTDIQNIEELVGNEETQLEMLPENPPLQNDDYIITSGIQNFNIETTRNDRRIFKFSSTNDIPVGDQNEGNGDVNNANEPAFLPEIQHQNENSGFFCRRTNNNTYRGTMYNLYTKLHLYSSNNNIFNNNSSNNNIELLKLKLDLKFFLKRKYW